MPNNSAQFSLDAMPPLIYKYFGKYDVEAVEDFELKVTPPNEFNALFEVTPRPTSEPVIRQEFEKMIDSEAGKKALNEALSKSEKFRRVYPKFRADPQRFYEEVAGIKQPICETLVDEVSKYFGLICFSEDPQHLLMWSHYSDGHKGIVIGFDPSKLNLGAIDPVNYVPRRVELNPPWQISDRGKMKAIITSKSDLWEYEREYRAMLILPSLKKRTLKNGAIGYFRAFPPASIVKVILGFRCSFAQRIRDALTNRGITASLQRAKPDPNEFAVILEDEV
jgi:Protein of unknown function (DUF2971)